MEKSKELYKIWNTIYKENCLGKLRENAWKTSGQGCITRSANEPQSNLNQNKQHLTIFNGIRLAIFYEQSAL